MTNLHELLERPQADVAGKRGASSNGKLVNVGFIGLGHMGAGMAANLLKAGHRVTVFNRTPAKAEALIARGRKVRHQHCRGLPRRCRDDHACQ
jgi:glutamyl-tRNA reductase